MFRRSATLPGIRNRWLLPLVTAITIATSIPIAARAGLVYTASGDIIPSDPSTWTSSTTGYIGQTSLGTLTVTSGTLNSSTGYIGYGTGSTGTVTIAGTSSQWTDSSYLFVGGSGSGALNITAGGSVSDVNGYIGCYAGSNGTVTVDGAGSTWTNTGDLGIGGYYDIGFFGNGTLNISNGGAVTTIGTTYVSPSASSRGAINFGSGGGTLTTVNLILATATQLTGTGTITEHGHSGWGGANPPFQNLVFDSAHGARQTSILNQPGQNITLNLDLSSSDGAGNVSVNSITVRDGVTIYSATSTFTGTATVDGAGSTWNGGGTTIGGILTISNGATMTSRGCVVNKTAQVDGRSSKWVVGLANSADWFVIGNSANGTVNITNGGAITTSCAQLFIGGEAAGVVNVDGPGSTWVDRSGAFWVGETDSHGASNGTLNITHGGSMSIGATLTLAVDDYQGKPLNWGIVNIDGYGSSCDAGAAEVGDGGIGILNITNGGRLRTNSWSYLGWSSMGTGAGGTVNVDGAGSKWNCTTYGISINMAAPGMLNITNGGVVTAPQLVIYGGGTKLAIDSQSLLEITIGGNGSVSGGSGGMTNNGIVRIAAGPAAQARQYTPISAGTLSGTGIWQALGGTWNLSSRQFTVSSLQTGASGAPVGIDLASIQRVLVSSSPTGGSLGASFVAEATSTPLSFTATTLSDGPLTSLDSRLGPGQSLLGGWTFTTDSGYTLGDPAYLSFGIGAGYSPEGLEVWHYNGSMWTPFSANDLTYDGNYASFTVNDLNGFAVTTIAVPEPGSLALLLAGAISLLACAWRRRRV